MKYWSGRTGNVPEDEGICEYTVVIDYKNVPFSFFFASVDRPKEIAIRHDGSAEICCSVKAATPYKHPPTVGNIYKDPWDTLRDRFAKMHTLLENYAKELNKRGLKHTCYRCAWDDNNSFKNYLEKLKF